MRIRGKRSIKQVTPTLAVLAACMLSGCNSWPSRRADVSRLSTDHAVSASPEQCGLKQTQSVNDRSAARAVQPVSHQRPVVELAEVPISLTDTDGSALSTREVLDGNEAAADEVEQLASPPPTSLDQAAANAPQPVDHFVSLALSRHPEILAARDRIVAAVNVIPQVRALPDPIVGNNFWPIHDQALQTAGGRVGHQFSYAQGVPWPEKLKTKAAIAGQEVQIARSELNRIEREIAEAVQLAYYEVWFAERALSILQESRAILNDLLQVAEARYSSGGSQQDVLRAQLEVDRLDDQIVGLVKQKEQAQADLATLVQQPVSLIPEVESEIDLDNVPSQLDSLLRLAEQCNPELQALVAEIRRDRQKQRLACLQQYPDFQLGLNYAIINDDNNVISPVANGHDNISFALGVTLPIWRDKIRAGLLETGARTSSSMQRFEARRNVIYGKLRRLIDQADALTEQAAIYDERIVPRSENTLKLAFADYRGDRVDFFSLVETYRELLMFETQLARIQATLAGTIAQIERTIGCPFEE